jgi:hypothetical protein
MRNIKIVFLLLLSTKAIADPHYFQALHPFFGGEREEKFLSTFKKPVEAHVDLFDSEIDDDMYLYAYIFTGNQNASFEINITCEPGFEEKREIWDAWPKIKYSNGSMLWSLDSTKEKQYIWFYTPAPPVTKIVVLKDSSSNIISNSAIQVPKICYKKQGA